jgi:hypothetical protein
MRTKKAMLAITCALVLFELILAGCAPKQTDAADGTGSSTSGAEAVYAPGSMMATHTVDQLGDTNALSKKLCLSCHPRETINTLTNDLLGQQGVNPHAAHTAAPECTDCHSAETAPSMYCNTCHAWEVPENWISPERTGAGPVPK